MPNRCVVYKCNSGYDSDRKYRINNGLPQLSQFTAPKEMLETWEKKISRGGGWKMTPKHTVCELHFEKKYLIDMHEINIDGTSLLCEKRQKKSLAKEAVPTIFDGYPTYMNKPAPKKRKSPRKMTTLPEHASKKIILEKKNRPDDLMVIDNIEEPPLEEVPVVPEEIILCSQPFSLFESISPHEVTMPSQNWHILQRPNFTSFFHIRTEAMQIDRYLKIVGNEAAVFLEGKKLNLTLSITSAADVSSELKKLQSL